MADMNRVSENEGVTIRLASQLDEDGEYDAFTSISVDVNVNNQHAGTISGTIVNRRRIPERMFLSAMDGHSGELQYIGVSLFEPRLGRSKLQSLVEGGDDVGFEFLYIDKMHLDDHFKRNGNSDVGAHAIRQLLQHASLQNVSSCIYILDQYEGMSRADKDRLEAEEQREQDAIRNDMLVGGYDAPPETEESLRIKEEKDQMMDGYARVDANQFIRNGFYQDAAIARNGGNDKRIIVAARNHWNRPQLSHETASAVEFYVGLPPIRQPVGRDAEILEVTKRIAYDCAVHTQGFPLPRPANNIAIDHNRAATYRAEVSSLVQEGGSLTRSHSLHAACALNDPTIVQTILEMDPDALESRDVNNDTPLMVAAAIAAGKSNNLGYPADQPVIDILRNAGAERGATNPITGLTAYGMFKAQHDAYKQMMQALTGNPVHLGGSTINIPGFVGLETRLMPPGGPTEADRTGGDSAELGILHYSDYEDMDSDY